jgi:hypothetical protein
LLRLSKEEFCTLNCDNAPKDLVEAFLGYAKPHVERNDFACVFEVGIADLGIPGLIREFYYLSRIHLGID